VALVATTSTACGAVTVSGAVYRPPGVMFPTAGSRLHLTDWFDGDPGVVAWNCWVCPGASGAEGSAGETAKIGTQGTSTTNAVPEIDGSDVLVAVMVTACGPGTLAGGV
jgi:hypothetical protein